MLKIGSIFIFGLSAILSLFNVIGYGKVSEDHRSEVIAVKKGGKELKNGQYVYVTLKDGSQTVGKIVGKRSSNKYYVKQLYGGHRGMVHVKYIRKMSKEEVTSFFASKKK